MAEILLQGINKIYPNGTHAVHDVDLHIRDGEFMIMVGPSGCAKSTILRMIAGLEVPTSGTVSIGGRVVNDVHPKDRDIAMVFQSYALYPHMTVADNLAFGLRLRKMSDGDIQKRIDDAARILGLENFLARKPKQLSGGQRQRVAMGRAIVREPQAFLMDEPLSNLDAKLRVQMRAEIAKLHQRLGTTTVYVTHDQVEALTLGQRICILKSGIVQQVDTPWMVYTNPRNVFVGSFIGSPGMNFMNGRLHSAPHGIDLQIGPWRIPLPQSVTSRIAEGAAIDGRQVIVGLRPEHITVGTDHPQTHVARVEGTVDLVESMGAESFIYMQLPVDVPDLSALADAQGSGGTPSMVAKSPGELHLPRGVQVPLDMHLEELHLFDPASQLSLLAPRDERIRTTTSDTRADSAVQIVTPGAVTPEPVHVPLQPAAHAVPAVAAATHPPGVHASGFARPRISASHDGNAFQGTIGIAATPRPQGERWAHAPAAPQRSAAPSATQHPRHTFAPAARVASPRPTPSSTRTHERAHAGTPPLRSWRAFKDEAAAAKPATNGERRSELAEAVLSDNGASPMSDAPLRRPSANVFQPSGSGSVSIRHEIGA